MDRNTVKQSLRRKRPKRTVETFDYAAFTRRIIRAHARRVGAGDIEALTTLQQLASEVDTAMRNAVQALRDFGYSWSDIANRLGVTRQAAQMRWGNRTDRGRLDERILHAGFSVSLPVLVSVFLDHYPGVPARSICPGCGFEYTSATPDCPTLAVVRPLLWRRRKESRTALLRLTPDQMADLHGRRRTSEHHRSVPPSPRSGPSLFDPTVGGR